VVVVMMMMMLWQEQDFVLSEPAMFLGGEMIVLLEGKAQRQTLGELATRCRIDA
jgi:hypothetical protein